MFTSRLTAPFIVVFMAIPACASGGRGAQDAVPPVDATNSCATRSDSPMWRQVHTENFSFCVPPDWRPVGDRSWRGDGGRIAWGQTQPPGVPFSVGRVVGGERDVVESRRLPTPIESRSSVETIGGVRVQLHVFRHGRTHTTRAEWTGTGVALSGEGDSANAAERHFEIYRTVRVTKPPSR